MARILISVLLVLILAAAAPAAASLKKGPYLQHPTMDGISILWETSAAGVDQLEWGASQNLDHQIPDPSPTRSHEHRISGLEPDTLYYYRITAEGNIGPIYSFVTAPDVCTSFKFILVGDTRSQHIFHQANVNKFFEHDADFVINTGDIIDHGDTPQENEDVWQIFFNIEQEYLHQVPLYPVFGNHDTETEEIWDRIFAPPGEVSGNERYYSYRFANSAFIVVNTQESYSEGSQQYLWLETELHGAYEDPGVQHIFVAFHVPPYSSGSYGNSESVQKHLVPLFVAYDVQAVMNGHDHNFQHLESAGVRYFVSGGGGASLSGKENPTPEMIEFVRIYHFTVIEVDGPEVVLSAYSALTGELFYTTSWTADMGKDPCSDPDDDDTNPDDDTSDDDNDDTDQADDDDQHDDSDSDSSDEGCNCGS